MGTRKIVTIQQPEHVPWLGFFDKMSKADIFVLLDNTQFKKRYFENRNKIRVKDGWQWVGIPVITKGRYKQNINDVLIDNSQEWRKKYNNSLLYAYSRARYFKDYFDDIKKIINSKWDKLIDINIEFISFFRKIFGLISVPLVKASSLNLKKEKGGSQLILDICECLDASAYISGPGGKEYLNIPEFIEKNIEVQFHHYTHPRYDQLHSPFISHMSSLDFLFNCGEEALGLFKKDRT